MKKIVIILCFIICITLIGGCEKNTKTGSSNNSKLNNNESSMENNNMNEFNSKINITINGKNFTATLEDNETSREFVKMLPLDITMNELNGNEKYYYFDNNLPSNSNKIDKINSGDIMLYGNNCLVLFYESFNTNYSYTRIGKFDNSDNIKDIVGNENIKVNISSLK